ADRAALATASPAQVLGLLADVGRVLCDLKTILASADGGGFDLILSPDTQQVLPATATTFGLFVFNQSTSTRTFDLALAGLPAGVTGHVAPTRVTLGPFGNTFPPVQITIDPIAGPLAPFTFTVTGTDALAPLGTRTVTGSVTVRDEIVQVVDVTATPGFANPGDGITAHVRLYNAVNRARAVNVYVGLDDANGVNRIFPFFAGSFALDLAPNVKQLDVPLALPANLAKGPYVLTAFVHEQSPEQQIPGATGKGPFFVGAPLAATVDTTPEVAPPGDVTVQTTVTLDRDAVPNPAATVLGAVGTSGGPARSVAVFGNRAYVCSDHLASVVDVSDPANPTVRSTFGPTGTRIADGSPSVGCSIVGGRLMMVYDKGFGPGGTFVPTSLAIYDLTDPSNPALVSNTTFPRGITGTIHFTDGPVGWLATSIFVFNPFSNFIFRQAGDMFGVDLTDVSAPMLRGRLFPPAVPGQDGTADYAGANASMVFNALRIAGDTAYVLTTTATGDGFATGPGNARVLVVDVSDPDAPVQTGDLVIPPPTMGQPGPVTLGGGALDGGIVLLSGDTHGFDTAASGQIGNVALTTLDVTTPTAPAIDATIVTQLTDPNGTSTVALGNGIFAVGGPKLGTRDLLLLVDATDPVSVRYVPYDVGAPIASMQRVGNLLYTTNASGLTIFQIDQITGPRLTVRVDVPKAPGVELVPGSFVPTPTQVLSGADRDTYVWDQPAVDTLTWQQVVHGLEVGESREVTLGGTVDFVVPTLGSGTLALPPAFVN